ncbi:hypothetical protein RF11_01358 [Thelohanellus kitauei]|uniref:Uncharacterized protein n=1 Tax=Thelohanellus kitauei TaxID=669202 RepID=A0A0C2J1R9_THEKT|nr:hypothetical protein RF11_01358 [Thelohanellus kitauei]
MQIHLKENTEFGLASLYNENEEMRPQFEMLPALAFCPINDVQRKFNLSSRAFQLLRRYIRRRHEMRRENPNFFICTWNQFDRTINDQPRTNNNIEGWHRLFSSMFNHSWMGIIRRAADHFSSDFNRFDSMVLAPGQDIYGFKTELENSLRAAMPTLSDADGNFFISQKILASIPRGVSVQLRAKQINDIAEEVSSVKQRFLEPCTTTTCGKLSDVKFTVNDEFPKYQQTLLSELQNLNSLDETKQVPNAKSAKKPPGFYKECVIFPLIWEVIRVLGTVTFEISDGLQSIVTHHNTLKPYIERFCYLKFLHQVTPQCEDPKTESDLTAPPVPDRRYPARTRTYQPWYQEAVKSDDESPSEGLT